MKDAEHFLQTMQSLNPEVDDYTDAIHYAMTQVPKVDSDRWFGEIGGKGVYFASSRESRWFPNMTAQMAATILVGELL